MHHFTESKISPYMEIKNSHKRSLYKNQGVCSSFFLYLSYGSKAHKRMTGKNKQILSTTFLSVSSAGIVSSWDVIKTIQYPQKNISQTFGAMSNCPLAWAQPNMAMIVNMGGNKSLLISQSSISISII